MKNRVVRFKDDVLAEAKPLSCDQLPGNLTVK